MLHYICKGEESASEPHDKVQLKGIYRLGQLQCDGSFRLSFNALSPELQFGIYGTMKDKILFETLSMKGTDWRVVTHLLRHPPEAQILSGVNRNDQRCRKSPNKVLITRWRISHT